jgi:hypothetical protein
MSSSCGWRKLPPAVNILNKQSWRNENGLSSSLEVGCELITPHFKNQHVTKCYTGPGRNWEQIKFRECMLPLSSESSVFCPIYKNIMI